MTSVTVESSAGTDARDSSMSQTTCPTAATCRAVSETRPPNRRCIQDCRKRLATRMVSTLPCSANDVRPANQCCQFRSPTASHNSCARRSPLLSSSRVAESFGWGNVVNATDSGGILRTLCALSAAVCFDQTESIPLKPTQTQPQLTRHACAHLPCGTALGGTAVKSNPRSIARRRPVVRFAQINE